MPRHHIHHESAAALERELIEIWRKLDHLGITVRQLGTGTPPVIPEVPPAQAAPVAGTVLHWAQKIEFNEAAWTDTREVTYPLIQFQSPAYTHFAVRHTILQGAWKQFNEQEHHFLRWTLYGTAEKTYPVLDGSTYRRLLGKYAELLHWDNPAIPEVQPRVGALTIEPQPNYTPLSDDPTLDWHDWLYWPVNMWDQENETLKLKLEWKNPKAVGSWVCYKAWISGFFVTHPQALYGADCPSG